MNYYIACIPKNWLSHFQLILRSSPSSELVDPVKSIVLFVSSFSSRMKQWIHVSSTVMNRRRNSSGLRWNISKHCFEIVMVTLMIHSEQTRHLADNFFIPNYSCNWNHCTMWYTCSLNKLAHFHSSIRQNNIVDFIDDSAVAASIGSRTRCITCGCTTTFKFIHPIVYNHKRWCRCAMNIIQFGFDFFSLNLSYVDVWLLHETPRFFPFCKKYKGCSF